MNKYFLLPLILLLFLGSCETEEQSPDKPQIIKKEKISGFVQKGPFVSGTSILMNELNSQMVQTGKVFTSTIINDMGLFELNSVELNSSFVEFTSSGFYFNEVSGEISNSPITLTSLSDISDKNSINVNVLTHLEKRRVETLMKEGKSFTESKTQSRNELLSVFSMSLNNDSSFEEFDISKNTEEGGILLGISIILQGNRSVGQLTELLSRIQNDFGNNGKLDDENILNSLRTSTLSLDFTQIRENIEKRFKELNNNSPVPDFEKQLKKFLSYRDYPLTITIDGEGTVEERIVSNPSGREYPYSTVVELTPVPKEGWVFESWGGDLSGNEVPNRITVDGDKSVTVKFKRRDYPLNLTIEGEGTVEERIVTDPNGRQYPFQTVVELTPVPKEGWEFDSWDGDLSGNETPKTIIVDKEKNVIVKFIRKDYKINFTIIGEGSVEEKIVSNPSGRVYPFQTVVELTPVPKEGWVFESWDGDLTGTDSPKNLTINGEMNVTVKFKRRDYPLNLTIIGEGTVEEKIVSDPNSRQYPFETVVELTPVPKEGWEFESWDGDLTGTETPKTITVDKEKNVTVKFKRKDYKINFTIIGEGSVEEKIVSTPSGRVYPFQTVVELTPVPKEGWVFESWGGDLTGTDSPKNLTIDKDRNVTVVFRQPIFRLGDNGITCICENVKVGEKGFINGVEYEVVDNSLLRKRRDEGVDMTKLCTSLVTDMSRLFENFQFDGQIGNWDVSNVIDMNHMFRNTYFNQPIGEWDVRKVTDMSFMFVHSPFNQSLKNWNVSKVKNMSYMFSISPFNQPIGEWDVSNVTNMFGMFSNSEFNQPIEDWDVSNVTDMGVMFGYSPFNQSIGKWNVQKVKDMTNMFGFSSFNKPIGDWDVSNVNWMNNMFNNSPFNQNISKWCVTNITSEPQGFSSNSPLTSQNKPKWGTCPD
jgi:surface protein